MADIAHDVGLELDSIEAAQLTKKEYVHNTSIRIMYNRKFLRGKCVRVCVLRKLILQQE